MITHNTLYNLANGLGALAMVTVVELPHCGEMTDRTIVRLRELHNLAFLDISDTAVTSWGLRSLAKTLKTDEVCDASDVKRFRGPWMLRILSIRDCSKVDDNVSEGLAKFPLLSAIGELFPIDDHHS